MGAEVRSSSRDTGASFAEILVAITLMGVLVLPIMSAVFATVRASSKNFDAAEVSTAIVNAADRVNRAPMSCDYDVYAKAAVQTQGWDPASAVVEEHHFVPPVNPADAGTWAAGACPNVDPSLDLVQRVTIVITSPSGAITRQIQVVKSNV